MRVPPAIRRPRRLHTTRQLRQRLDQAEKALEAAVSELAVKELEIADLREEVDEFKALRIVRGY